MPILVGEIRCCRNDLSSATGTTRPVMSFQFSSPLTCCVTSVSFLSYEPFVINLKKKKINNNTHDDFTKSFICRTVLRKHQPFYESPQLATYRKNYVFRIFCVTMLKKRFLFAVYFSKVISQSLRCINCLRRAPLLTAR